MTTARYRACVLLAALAWFMVGLHVPAFHALEHGGTIPTTIVLVTALLAALAVTTTVALLHAGAPPTPCRPGVTGRASAGVHCPPPASRPRSPHA